MAFLRVLVLICADLLASYVMFIMQTYLTDVWKLGFVHAAGIMNIANGLPKVLPLLFYCFVHAGLGNKWMLFLSSISYAIGLGFLSMSTPPVLHKATGTCKNYDKQCIGHTQKTLFYTALALIAVGMSGHIVSLVALFVDQFEKKPKVETTLENDDNEQGGPSKFDKHKMIIEALEKKNGRGNVRSREYPLAPPPRPPRAPVTNNQNRNKPEDGNEVDLLSLQFQPVEALLALVTREQKKVFRSCMLVLIPVVALIALPYIKRWDLRFGIPAIITSLATLFFLFGFHDCKEEKSEESAVSNFFRVILAATLKMFKRLPSSSAELYEDNSKTGQKLPHTNDLRCLDKAAIEEGPRNRKWIRCTVTQVEQTKIIIHMFPIWVTLILCGLVSSVGSTYFIEQANHMNYKVGKLKLPDSLLLILYASAKLVLKAMYTGISNSFGNRLAPRIGIAFATISATLCCIVAAAVETKRHEVIIGHGLVNKPDDKIPMTVFWILPQYLLLACLDSFYENSVTQFLSDQSPPLMKKYLVFLNPGLSGLGFFGSVLSVYVVGRVSKKHGKQNWFQNDLNASRLDRYYWTLAGLSAVNFMWFLGCACLYPYRDMEGSNGDEEKGIQDGNGIGAVELISQVTGDTIEANLIDKDPSDKKSIN